MKDVELYPGKVYERSEGEVCIIANQFPLDGKGKPQRRGGKVWWYAYYVLGEYPTAYTLSPSVRSTESPVQVEKFLPDVSIEEMGQHLDSSLPEDLRQDCISELQENTRRGVRLLGRSLFTNLQLE